MSEHHSLSSLHGPLAAALAPRVVSAHLVRETPLTRVFCARTPGDGCVALHLVRDEFTAMAEDPPRARAALARLTAPSDVIPPVLWAELVPSGQLCYATPWTECEPALAAAQRGALGSGIIAAAAHELCGTLGGLHADGMLHGSIAPSALAWVPWRSRFLLDATGVFAALVAAGAAPARLIRASGALVYASPELADGRAHDGRAHDGRADMYALGATVYELLTGRPPFGGRTTSTTMAAVLVDSRTGELATAPSSGTTAVIDAVLRAIEKLPEDRWATMADFGDALHGTRRTTPMPPPTLRAGRFGCANAMLATVGLLGALGAAALRMARPAARQPSGEVTLQVDAGGRTVAGAQALEESPGSGGRAAR